MLASFDNLAASIASGGKTLASGVSAAELARPLGDRLGVGVAVVAVSKPRSQLLDLCALWWSIQRLRDLSAQSQCVAYRDARTWSAQEIVAYTKRLGALESTRVI